MAVSEKAKEKLDEASKEIKEAIDNTKKRGIRTLGFFIIGSPGETYSTAVETIKFSLSLDLDYVQFTKLIPYPNSELYDMMMEDGFGDYWRDFTLDIANEKPLPIVRSKLTSKEADTLVRKANRRFYFRLSYVFRAIRRIRSFLEFIKRNGSIISSRSLFNSQIHCNLLSLVVCFSFRPCKRIGEHAALGDTCGICNDRSGNSSMLKFLSAATTIVQVQTF